MARPASAQGRRRPPDDASRAIVAVVAIGTAYVVARLLVWLAGTTTEFGDTVTYEAVSRHSVLSKGFLAGHKPTFLPFVFKVVGHDGMRTGLQLVASIACWGFAAAVLSRAMRTTVLRWATAVAVLVFSLAWPVVGWDRALLSESWSISFTVVVLALLMAFLRRPVVPLAVAVVAVGFLWAQTRDSNAYLLLMVAALAGIGAVRSRPRRPWLVLAGGVLAVALPSIALADLGERWRIPLLHVAAGRVVLEADVRADFVDMGMPFSPVVEQDARRFAYGDGGAFYAGETSRATREWFLEHGRRAYPTYVLGHPGYAVGSLARDRALVVSPFAGHVQSDSSPRLEAYVPTVSVLPRPVTAVVFPANPDLVLALALLCGIALAVLQLRRGFDRRLFVPLVLLASTLPHGALVYFGDALEVGRHALLVVVSLRLGVILAVLGIADHLLAGRRGGQGGDDLRPMGTPPSVEQP